MPHRSQSPLTLWETAAEASRLPKGISSASGLLRIRNALGAVGFGNYAGANGFPFGVSLGWIAASFTNDTGGTLPEFTVGYRGEQWRDAGNGSPDPQEMIFEYGFGSSFATISSWTAPGGLFDWTSPVASDVKKAVDGNTAGLVAGLGGTIGGLNWLDGETLYLRWREYNDAGSDHGLAIDNFSFRAGEAAAVPEPGGLPPWHIDLHNDRPRTCLPQTDHPFCRVRRRR